MYWSYFFCWRLFGYLTAQHPAFTAAGFTAALIIVFGGQGEPWRFAWMRVLYTIMGAVIAFAVGALIWPVHARVGLRHKLASILDGAGALYRAVTAAALQGIDNEPQVRELNRQLHDLRRGITQQMDEARNELPSRASLSRTFNQGEYQAFVDQADQVRRRLTAMAEDSALYVQVQRAAGLGPVVAVVDGENSPFLLVADAVRKPGEILHSADLDAAMCALEADLAKLREQRATAPLALDRMLPFWALVFNLREIAQDVQQLESLLPAV